MNLCIVAGHSVRNATVKGNDRKVLRFTVETERWTPLFGPRNAENKLGIRGPFLAGKVELPALPRPGRDYTASARWKGSSSSRPSKPGAGRNGQAEGTDQGGVAAVPCPMLVRLAAEVCRMVPSLHAFLEVVAGGSAPRVQRDPDRRCCRPAEHHLHHGR